MDETLGALGAMIAAALPGVVTGHQVAHGELIIVATIKVLRDDERCQYFSIIDVTAIDWPSREARFDIVYHLLSRLAS